jgi:hypothetical protein
MLAIRRVRPEARRPAREGQAQGWTTGGGSSLRTSIGRGRGSGEDPLSVLYSPVEDAGLKTGATELNEDGMHRGAERVRSAKE